MKRTRPPDQLAAAIAHLRASGPLPEKISERTREVAALWMEQDARSVLTREAPLEVRQALFREYTVTGFVPVSMRAFDNGYRELTEESAG